MRSPQSTKPDTAIDMKEVESLIEVRGVYDGWSIAVMKDGRWLNRWKQPQLSGPTISARARRTDEWIHQARTQGEQDGWNPASPSAAVTLHHGR